MPQAALLGAYCGGICGVYICIDGSHAMGCLDRGLYRSCQFGLEHLRQTHLRRAHYCHGLPTYHHDADGYWHVHQTWQQHIFLLDWCYSDWSDLGASLRCYRMLRTQAIRAVDASS